MTFNIPSRFYYIKEQITYSKKPTGRINISRLANNQAPFVRVNHIPTAKTLIFADWTSGHWPYFKVLKVKKIFSELIDKGFTLYLWHSETLRPFNEQILRAINDWKFRKGISPEFSTTIQEQLSSQHQVPKDQIHILSNYEIDHLIRNELPDIKYQLRVSDLLRLHANNQDLNRLSKILAIAHANSPIPIEIAVNEWDPDRKNTYIRFLNTLSLMGTSIRNDATLERIKISHPLPEDLNCIIEHTFQEPLVQSLSLIFRDQGTLEHVAAFCKTFPFLKKLHITNSRLLSDLSPADLLALDLGLNCLEQLHIENTLISASVLAKLLSSATQIRSVVFEQSEVENDEPTDLLNQDVVFPHLERLVLNGPKAMNRAMKHLLLHAPRLTILSSSSFNNCLNESSALNLSTVEELTLKNVIITEEETATLFNYFKKLKKLSLNAIKLHSGFFNPPQLYLIDELELISVTMSFDDLITVLKIAKKLSKLTCKTELSGCACCLLKKANAHDPLHFPNIQELIVSGADESLNQDIIALFLRTAPNLKFLNHKPLSHYIAASVHSSKDSGLVSQPKRGAPLDANTASDTNDSMHIKKYFYSLIPWKKDPNPTKYRTRIYLDFGLNPSFCSPDVAFYLYGHKPLDLQAVYPRSAHQIKKLYTMAERTKENSTRFLGVIEYSFTGEWQELPSLTPHDIVNDYAIDPPETTISFAYSKQHSKYYIKGPNGLNSSLSILLEVPSKPKRTVPQEILSLVNELSQYNPGPLDLSDKKNRTGADYLSAITSQKKGACRHRAFAFKALMAERHPDIPVRIIMNIAHAFIEVQIDNDWITYDLGGYWTNLSIDDSNKPIRSLSSNICSLIFNHIRAPIEGLIMQIKPLPPLFSKLASTDSTSEQSDEEDTDSDSDSYVRANNVSINSTDTVAAAYTGLKQDCELALTTWETQKPIFKDTASYLNDVLHKGLLSNRLIETRGSIDLEALQLSMQAYCLRHQPPIPYFYIDSAEDLNCSGSFIYQEPGTNTGQLRPGPGGVLHDFLTKPVDPKNPPILLINYSRFTPSEVVRFIGVVDTVRHADGTPIPKEALVIGLIDIESPDCYRGADLYSRFSQIETSPLSSATLRRNLNQLTPLLEPSDPAISDDAAIIPLYHSPDWESILLGNWQLNGESLTFIPGALQHALAKRRPLVLHNAPWEQSGFKRFWDQAIIRGKIIYQGQEIGLPTPFSLSMLEGYNWQKLKESAELITDAKAPEGSLVLNPGCLKEYMLCHECKDSKIYATQGYFELYQNQELSIYLTRALSKDEWAMWLDGCSSYSIRPKIYVAPGTELPLELEVDATPELHQPTWCKHIAPRVSAIISTDIDCTIASILEDEPNWRVIDVSECEQQDLLVYLDYHIDKQTGLMSFTQKESVVLRTLKAGESLILKGSFSPFLIDALAPVLLAAKTGRIILVSDKALFPFLDNSRHEVSIDEKKQALAAVFPQGLCSLIDEVFWAKESIARIRARLSHLKRNPNAQSCDAAWDGMHRLEHNFNKSPFNLENSAQEADDFIQARLKAVNAVLQDEPYVFLSGLTGVGKSTFVEKYCRSQASTVYEGESQIKVFAQDHSNGRKILFIDEANLSTCQWSAFEGLYNSPPGLLTEGEYVELTSNHRVIFAGNPVSYSDDRHLASLFARHGNALVFDPMPEALIYHSILKPLFKGSVLENEADDLCKPLLQIYSFVCSCSKERILVSPRELEMIAVLIHSYAYHYREVVDLIPMVKAYAYHIVSPMIPKEYKSAFECAFKPKNLNATARNSTQLLLEDLLRLSQFRLNRNLKDHLSTAGLGGIILEGGSGVGKTHMVFQTLKNEGYVNASQDNLGNPKRFYPMPVSMSEQERELLLLKAFHEGAVVIIEEMNSTSLMERLLNALLMGKTPAGLTAERPGFFIIATQNPINMGGRKSLSSALARRMIHQTIEPYSPEEVFDIIRKKGISTAETQVLVKVYESMRAKAEAERLMPKPHFGDLYRFVEALIEKRNRSIGQGRNGFFRPIDGHEKADVVIEILDTLERRSAL